MDLVDQVTLPQKVNLAGAEQTRLGFQGAAEVHHCKEKHLLSNTRNDLVITIIVNEVKIPWIAQPYKS